MVSQRERSDPRSFWALVPLLLALWTLGGDWSMTDYLPRLLQAPGGWLAVSPGDVRPRIGVMGRDQGDAITRWKCAYEVALGILRRSQPEQSTSSNQVKED